MHVNGFTANDSWDLKAGYLRNQWLTLNPIIISTGTLLLAEAQCSSIPKIIGLSHGCNESKLNIHKRNIHMLAKYHFLY